MYIYIYIYVYIYIYNANTSNATTIRSNHCIHANSNILIVITCLLRGLHGLDEHN